MNIGDTIVISKFSNITILGEHMHINELNIENIGCIKKLDLKFNDKFNVICGANGIGKTTILTTIADAFTQVNDNIKRNSEAEMGSYTINISQNHESNQVFHVEIKAFSPSDKKYTNLGLDSNKILNFTTKRDLNYINLNQISRDPKRDLNTSSDIIKTGVSANDIKNWFINRIAFSQLDNSLHDNEKSNLELSMKLFGLLDSNIIFKTINPKTFDIILSTSNGDIYFEYLSSGYKSCIYIVMGIIKEIEYRHTKNPIKIEDFDGCVLIDEIEEHLHPTWQAHLVNVLKKIFPKTQFIVTTHSPSVLQTLNKNEIIPLYLDENHKTAIKPLNLGDYGLQGWTLEEILKDVMGMPSTTSTLYSNTMEAFNRAMNEEDQEEILKQYRLLLQMLHPNNPLRRLLQIQVAEWEE